MLTIITPSYRQNLLPQIKESIRFEQIKEWIIVYDPTKTYAKKTLFNHPQIRELHIPYKQPWSRLGNSQRDFALELVESGWIYFLDDDNIVHPSFWEIASTAELPYFYSFDMINLDHDSFVKGGNVTRGKIDTAMFLVNKEHIGDIKWSIVGDDVGGDFFFIDKIQQHNPKAHKYIPTIAAYHNKLVPRNMRKRNFYLIVAIIAACVTLILLALIHNDLLY
jgi:hypothetical protein